MSCKATVGEAVFSVICMAWVTLSPPWLFYSEERMFSQNHQQILMQINSGTITFYFKKIQRLMSLLWATFLFMCIYFGKLHPFLFPSVHKYLVFTATFINLGFCNQTPVPAAHYFTAVQVLAGFVLVSPYIGYSHCLVLISIENQQHFKYY